MPTSVTVAKERAAALKVPPAWGEQQSIAIPESARSGRSAIYRHWRFQHELLQSLDPSIQTVHDMFESAANSFPDKRCLGHRPYDPSTKTFGPYVWQTYQTVQTRRANLGLGLVHLHKTAGVEETRYGIGVWCQNRPEWQITDLATMSQGLYSVSIYDTLGPNAAEFIVNHAQLACVVTSFNHIAALLRLKPRIPSLKIIVCLDPLDAGEQPGYTKRNLLESLGSDLDVKIFDIYDVEEIGKGLGDQPYNPPQPEDMITINYTSGTTGDPKGVVLTHRNAIASISCAMLLTKQGPNDLICSFLPLAHILQRVTEHAALWSGNAIGYFHGDISALVEDIKLLRPTGFTAVPRLYSRFGNAIKAATIDKPGMMGTLSRHVTSVKLQNLSQNLSAATNKHALYDRLWSRKISSQFGLERCDTMVSAAAHLDPSLHRLLSVVFANKFIQAYGLTETYATGLCQLDNDYQVGTCGAVTPACEVCLQDIPDMDYFATDLPHPRGELLIRGPSIFECYFKNEAETSAAKDPDGWFRTGDVCSVDECGRFRIIDRRKSFLKLSHGEYISPERIENTYLANCSWMASAYVHGDFHQHCLVGLIGVAPNEFVDFASETLGEAVDPLNVDSLHMVLANPKVVNRALEALDKVGKKCQFNSYERVRSIKLMLDPFTVENELLTPTFKLKRPQIARTHKEIIDELYGQLKEQDEREGKAKLRL